MTDPRSSALPELMTVRELASRAGRSPTFVQGRIDALEIPSIAFNDGGRRRHLVPADAAAAFITAQRRAQEPDHA